MKIKNIFLIIVTIIMFGIMGYANENFNNGYEKLIETFNDIESEFKFYNVKANLIIEEDTSIEEINDIIIELSRELGIKNPEKLIETDKKTSRINTSKDDKNKSISIIGSIKNNKESYIMVDIFENKLYKNIVDIYDCIENTLKPYSSNLEISTCIAGEYTKKLQNQKYDDILAKILYNMNATVIEKVEEDNFLSITAYSDLLDEYYLEYLGSKINLNIGLRYSENDDKTMIYLATPIIKLDY